MDSASGAAFSYGVVTRAWMIYRPDQAHRSRSSPPAARDGMADKALAPRSNTLSDWMARHAGQGRPPGGARPQERLDRLVEAHPGAADPGREAACRGGRADARTGCRHTGEGAPTGAGAGAWQIRAAGDLSLHTPFHWTAAVARSRAARPRSLKVVWSGFRRRTPEAESCVGLGDIRGDL